MLTKNRIGCNYQRISYLLSQHDQAFTLLKYNHLLCEPHVHLLPSPKQQFKVGKPENVLRVAPIATMKCLWANFP